MPTDENHRVERSDNHPPREKSDITKDDALAAIDYSLDHPRVFHTPEEVERARDNATNTEWGRRVREQVTAIADSQRASDATKPFVECSGEEIRTLAPIEAPDGVTYYGFPRHQFESVSKGNMCPIDGSRLTVEFTDPGRVVCEEGHEFPGTHDGVEITDEGDGWVAEDVPENWAAADHEGARFWFVAQFNGWSTKRLAESVESLAYAYALTEDQKYARTGAQVLDVLATAFAESGPLVDFMGEPGTKIQGRLYRATYSPSYFLVTPCIRAIDLIWPSGELDCPSPTTDGATIVENLAENLVVDGADYCWRFLHDTQYSDIFHGGTAACNRAMLAASSLLGLDVGYAEWTIDGPISLDNFLANTVFRDGGAIETSSLYARNPDGKYFEWAEAARHLRTEPYPEGENVYDTRRFVDLNTTALDRLSIAGRLPSYGDTSAPDVDAHTGPYQGEFWTTLRLYCRADDPDSRRNYAQRLADIAGGDPNQLLGEQVVEQRDFEDADAANIPDTVWHLFTLDGPIEGFDREAIDGGPRPSGLLPAKGMALLRPESGFDRGAMVRYGVTLVHGHADELGLYAYGAGRELTFDQGHLPQRHFKHGFLWQTVSHNTAVVNETSQLPPEDDGGSVELFASRPGYGIVEVSNPAAYAHEDVETYRRLTALVDTPGADSSEGNSYLFDVFRVGGAERTDYSFHGGGIHFDTDLDLESPQEGSVASPEYRWGDAQRSNGTIEGFEDEETSFNPPPGNGYGYLYAPRRASGTETWSATWRVDESRGSPGKLRLTMLGEADREVVVANGPDLLTEKLNMDPEEYSVNYVLARDERPASQFVSVIEPAGEAFPVEGVERLDIADGKHGNDDPEGGQFSPVAIAVSLAGSDATDYLVSTHEGRSVTASGPDVTVTTDAAFAMVRVDSEGVRTIRMESGTHLDVEHDGQRVECVADAAAYGGTITAVEEETPGVVVDTDLLADELVGRYVLVDSPEYSHNSPYRVEGVEATSGGTRIHFEPTSLVVARGRVEAVSGDTLESPTRYPLTRTRHYYIDQEAANEYLDGRQVICRATGERTTIEGVGASNRELTVADASGFDPGDVIEVVDLKPGDRCTVPSSVAATRAEGFETDGGRVTMRSDDD